MNHLAANAAAVLLAAIWQGAVLAVVVAFTLRLLPAVSASTRSLIWTATFGLLVAMHFRPTSSVASTVPAHQFHLAPSWSIAVVVVWLALSLFRATEFLLSAYRLNQIARRATLVRLDDSFLASLSRLTSGSTSYIRSYTLCTSPDVDRPSVLGFFHPRILLPEGLLGILTPAEFQQILLHETEHLRRSDDWINLLQKLALVVFPLNPVLFWVERRLCLERELACDARVLAAGENIRKSYATTLTRLAEHSIMRRGLNLALGILGQRPRPSELSTRVHRILVRPARTLTRTQTRLATATVLVGVLTLATTLAHTPTLVTFAPEVITEQATNLATATPASDTWVPKLVQTRAVMRSSTRPNYRTIETVAHVPSSPVRRPKKARTLQRITAAPRVMNTSFDRPEADYQPRLTLTVASGSQVQQLLVPAVAYVPAYAAVRTPDGWIIFQL